MIEKVFCPQFIASYSEIIQFDFKMCGVWTCEPVKFQMKINECEIFFDRMKSNTTIKRGSNMDKKKKQKQRFDEADTKWQKEGT